MDNLTSDDLDKLQAGLEKAKAIMDGFIARMEAKINTITPRIRPRTPKRKKHQ